MKKIIGLCLWIFLLGFSTPSFAANWDLQAVHNWEHIVWNVMFEYTTGRVFRYKEGAIDRMLIELKNAREPQGEDRAFYNAWVKNEDTGEFIDLGPLENTRDNFYEWELRRGTDDITWYNYFVITFEWNDGDPAKWTHVYEWAIFDTTLEYIDAIMQEEAAKTQVIVDIVLGRLGKLTDKTRNAIKENLFLIRQRTITSTESNEYKLQVLFILDSVAEALQQSY